MQQNLRTAWRILLAVLLGTVGVTVLQQPLPVVQAGGASTCDSGCWGIFPTSNGGKSWKKVADSPAGHPLGAVACPSVTTCYALAATSSNAYNTSVVGTTNGGKTWSVHNMPDTAFAIVCPGQTACFLNAGFTVLATQDGFGHTRETLARSVLHNLRLTDVSCPATAICYASSFRSVCDSNGEECDQVASSGAVTADGGRTWTKTLAPPARLARLSCPGAAVCYAIAGESGSGFVSLIERSGDGTRTWQRQLIAGGTPVPPIAGIACAAADTCYAVGGSFGAAVTIIGTHVPGGAL